MNYCMIAGLLLVVGIGVVLGIVLGFSMLAVAVTIIKRYELIIARLHDAAYDLTRTVKERSYHSFHLI